MSKVVGKRTKIVDGTEYDYDVTCCMMAQGRVKDLLELETHMKAIIDYMRPEQFGHLIVICNMPDIEMNYCPICGDAINKKDKIKCQAHNQRQRR